jgi:hypothetical protein
VISGIPASSIDSPGILLGDQARVERRVSRSSQVVGDCLVFVQTKVFRIGPHEAFIKDATG